jgi:hypothetical protein
VRESLTNDDSSIQNHERPKKAEVKYDDEIVPIYLRLAHGFGACRGV